MSSDMMFDDPAGMPLLGDAGSLGEHAVLPPIPVRRREGLFRLRRRPCRVVVVGAGDLGYRIIEELLKRPRQFEIIGLFDERKTRIASEVRGVPVRGTLQDLIILARAELPDQIIVTISNARFERLRSIFQSLVVLPVDLRLTFDTISPAFRMQSTSYIGNIQLLDISEKPLKGWRAALKVLEDKGFAVVALSLLGPLMLLIALLIKLDSRGPVFFKQERFGYNDKVIKVLKFRSMFADKGDRSGAQRTVRGDARVTRIGRILRAFSLDELPQLINVLKGDMSLVGPRAHAVAMRVGEKLYNETVQEYSARHRVRPGMTGLAQISGSRGEVVDVEAGARRVQYDLDYIYAWSLWLDIKIIFKSAWVVLFERGNSF